MIYNVITITNMKIMKNQTNSKTLSRLIGFASISIAVIAFVASAHAAYGYYGSPSYPYAANNSYYGQSNQTPLQVSCYPSPLTARIGQNVTWYANVNGGIGNYSFSWTGDEGLYASGSSVVKAYVNPAVFQKLQETHERTKS